MKEGNVMRILEIQNLSKTYGSGETMVKALDNVSFSVDKGEFVAIVGPSGSGKSTLIHILGGVDTPSSGKVIIDKTDISKLDETALAIFRRRQIGLVYQFYNLIINKVLSAAEIPFNVNWLLIFVVIAVVFLLIGSTMLYSVKKLKENSVVESLKDDIC